MGHAIERVALERGHQIVLKITSSNRNEFTSENLAKADVAIEFTSPEAAPVNVELCLNSGTSVVCGTTGWNDQLERANSLATQNEAAFLQASNFSIGVNIFFEVNKLLAKLLEKQQAYKVSLQEVHHLQKKDKPSGTAITLAEQIIAQVSRLNAWKLSEFADSEYVLPITALREESVPGTHSISWKSAEDTIEIVHTAHNRDGFALGAVLAAEFIKGKKGVFTMQDVLAI